jgi:hypothetical protein
MGFKIMEKYNGESAELVDKYVPKGKDFDEIYTQVEVDGIKYLTDGGDIAWDENLKDNAEFGKYSNDLMDGLTFRLIKGIKPYRDGGRGIEEYVDDAILVTEVKNPKTLEKIASVYNKEIREASTELKW